jgi:hypothetical protein
VNSNGEWKSVKDLNDENSAACAHSVEVIQYKFPKNFKLKRRKKINLIASGASGMNTNSNSTNLNRAKTKSSLRIDKVSTTRLPSNKSKIHRKANKPNLKLSTHQRFDNQLLSLKERNIRKDISLSPSN